MAKLKKELSINEVLGNVLININDLYNKRTLSLEDFSKIAGEFYGYEENNSLLKALKKDYNIFLFGKINDSNISISKESFENMEFIYRGCKYYDLHFNKGNIKFEIKGKEPSDEMRHTYRKILDIFNYEDIEKATQKYFKHNEDKTK